MTPDAWPTGTVTFLFTDIEGSTRLWESDGDSMDMALSRHDELVQGAIARSGGVVFASGGDGFAAAFQRASDAVAAACSAQRELATAGLPFKVRMGLHTGEARERGRNYFGPPVNRAARVMTAAHGGQILATHATAGLVAEPGDLVLVDLGDLQLKGIDGVVRVFRVDPTGVEPNPRAPSSTQDTRGNLPRLVSSYVGDLNGLRERCRHLRDRPVTLTGPGGVGKTRCALEMAWLVIEDHPDGVWMVDLAVVDDPDTAIVAVAGALGVSLQAGLDVLAATVEWMRGRRMMLVLDNCEHVVHGISPLVVELGRRCPTVAVLATSREPLGVPGEQVQPVSTLDPSSDAVDLYVDRALAANPEFDRGRWSSEVEALCRRLDGIPLAIELAAARARTLTPAESLARLDDRFKLLRGGQRLGTERHQTLRATVEWSHQLLGTPQRTVFRRLAVFAGFFDLDAAMAVCDPDGDLDVLEVLPELADKSMVVADTRSETTRFRLLETLREFAQEQLDTGELEECRLRHVAHYRAVAEEAHRLVASPRQLEGFELFDQHLANCCAAAAWSLDQDRFHDASALLGAMGWYLVLQCRSESDTFATRCAAAAELGLLDDPRTLCWLASHLQLRGDAVRQADLSRLARAAADPTSTWWSMASYLEGMALYSLNRPDEALSALRSAVSSLREPATPMEKFWVLFGGYQITLIETADSAMALEHLERHARQTRIPSLISGAAVTRSTAALFQGDVTTALESAQAAVREAAAARSLFDLGFALAQCANSCSYAPASAATQMQAAVTRLVDLRLVVFNLLCLDHVAAAMSHWGHHRSARKLLGFLSANVPGWTGPALDRRARLVKGYAADVGTDWGAEGSAMTADDAMAFALAELASIMTEEEAGPGPRAEAQAE